VAALFVVAMFAWGIAFYGLGFFLRELHDLRGWSVAALSWVTFAFYMAWTALNFVVSRWLGRRRPRRVFAAGAVTLAAAVLAIGHASGLGQLVGIYLVMAFGWACLSLTPISATVLWWFPDSSATPLTVALTGASVGGVVFVPLLDALARWYSFSVSLAVVAAMELVVVGWLALVVIRQPPSDDGDDGDDAGEAVPAGTAGTTEHAPTAWWVLRRAEFWPLSTGLALGLLVQVGFLVHQLSILDDTVSKGAAARIVAATTAAAMAGRLAFVALTARVSAAGAGAGFLVLQSAALLLLAAARGPVASLLSSCLFGLGVGVLVVIAPLLTRSTFPLTAFTAVFPVVSVGYQVAIALGAPVVALGRDALGGYGPTLVLLALVDGMAAVAIAVNRWQTRAAPEVVPTPARDAPA
jgi:hypothetical protein